mmetsp:Transcript_2859/g.4164  ORF Transcript_2859/g.4164 Transcript_2859/m.4164 type:complete len:95 (+) Transcript_2859:1732-2016(+)
MHTYIHLHIINNNNNSGHVYTIHTTHACMYLCMYVWMVVFAHYFNEQYYYYCDLFALTTRGEYIYIIYNIEIHRAVRCLFVLLKHKQTHTCVCV